METNLTYSWSAAGRGNFNSKVSAELVHHEINRIGKTVGPVTANVLVNEARPETSPLHPLFEWNDSVAGEKFRRFQANQVIQSVRVEFVSDGKDAPKQREKMPAFVSEIMVPGESEINRNWMPLLEVRDDPVRWQRFLTREINSIAALLNRTHDAAEMEPVRQGVEAARALIAAIVTTESPQLVPDRIPNPSAKKRQRTKVDEAA